MKLAILAVPALVFMAGCQSFKGPISGRTYYAYMGGLGEEYFDELRQDYVNRRSDLPEKIKRAILNKKILVGMTKIQAIKAWSLSNNKPGGVPYRINTSVGSWGKHEQWVLNPFSIYSQTYLYFENGKLTSWQQ